MNDGHNRMWEINQTLPNTTKWELLGLTYVYTQQNNTIEGHVSDDGFASILGTENAAIHEYDDKNIFTVINVFERLASNASDFHYWIPHNFTVVEEEG